VPNLATCDNVDDVLVIDPRPGNATSNDAVDNIAALSAAVAAVPGRYRRRVLVRLDGAGFSHMLLEPEEVIGSWAADPSAVTQWRCLASKGDVWERVARPVPSQPWTVGGVVSRAL
jgi:hypothetical protein